MAIGFLQLFMKVFRFLTLIFIINFILLFNVANAITSTTTSNSTTNLPTRIITLSPHLTELVFSAGAGHKIVGAVSYSDFPKEAKSIPNIGDVNHLNFEKIIALKPTIAYAWQEGNKASDLENLKKLGIQVQTVSIKSLKDISDFILKVGSLTKTEHIARRQANLFNQKIAKLEFDYNSKITKKSKKKVFFEIWHRPLMTLNKQHIITKIINRCGGNNIFANLNNIAPVVSLESIRLNKPDVIFLSGTLYQDKNVLNEWLKYTDIPAIKNKRIYFLNPDTIERPTVRLLEGYEDICTKLNY